MAEFTVNDDVLTCAAATEYFSRADSRVMIGLRFALEALGIPLPEYARRRPPGRPPSRAVTAAYMADNPGTQRPVAKPVSQDPLGERRLGAAVAKAQARAAKRQASSDLFNETFNG